MSSAAITTKTYFAVFGALMLFTGLTVWVAYQDLGHPWNDVIALTIAVTKATLVILYFMHVRTSGRLTAIVVAAGFFWLAILFALTLGDFLTRDWLPTFVPL